MNKTLCMLSCLSVAFMGVHSGKASENTLLECNGVSVEDQEGNEITTYRDLSFLKVKLQSFIKENPYATEDD